MRNSRMTPLYPALVVAAQFYTGIASAHIHLLDPIPRYPNEVSGENKSCPCGVGESNRTCNVETDRSDPDRSVDRVTTLTAGSEITVRFDEYVGHSGRFRVAFDESGADLADFNAHPLADIPDPSGKTGNTGQGSIWEMQVTVPNTPCTDCTLQLIQMMDGDMSAPVADPVGRSSYYQCADIEVVAAAPDAGPGGGSPAPDDSGCSLGGAPAQSGWAAFGGLSALALLGWKRRRCS
jgi:hypothetical protein